LLVVVAGRSGCVSGLTMVTGRSAHPPGFMLVTGRSARAPELMLATGRGSGDSGRARSSRSERRFRERKAKEGIERMVQGDQNRRRENARCRRNGGRLEIISLDC